MGVEGCTKCIKYMLFFFNFIFWLAGCVILGVSLWLRHDQKTSSLLDLKYEDASAPNTFYISVYILIAVGAVMMFVGFLGCYGAIQESQCLLGTFFACLVILFACEVAAGIWGFIHKDKISKELINFYDSVYDKGMTQTIQDKKDAAAAVLKVFHETLQCCGKEGVTSFVTGFATNLCPKKDSILDIQEVKLTVHFQNKQLTQYFAHFRQIFEMIFSMVLCCGIRNSPVY
uniref:Tetraspanin n=1 Tax=Astyanax mexicanus TaxID=7994 RepID=A0A8B9L962_ASTMX